MPEKFLANTEPQEVLPSIERLENVERFIRNTGAVIRHGGDRAYYAEGPDHIQMPNIATFRDSESYYATLAHEVTHWTKHESRLNRDFGRVVWGDEGYAKEELVAEIGSAFLCADLGITPEVREDHAAYIESWLKALKNDRKLIFSAAGHASRAVELLKSKQSTAAPDTKMNGEGIPFDGELYASPPMQIGNHVWRLLIAHDDRGTHTRYEFKDQTGLWHRSQEWKGYNINDTYLGLPRSLNKLYEREQPALIRFGLIAPPQPTNQLEMTF